jgi:hypothetical protein
MKKRRKTTVAGADPYDIDAASVPNICYLAFAIWHADFLFGF